MTAADPTRVLPQPPAAAASPKPKQDFGRVLAGQRAKPRPPQDAPAARPSRPTKGETTAKPDDRASSVSDDAPTDEADRAVETEDGESVKKPSKPSVEPSDDTPESVAKDEPADDATASPVAGLPTLELAIDDDSAVNAGTDSEPEGPTSEAQDLATTDPSATPSVLNTVVAVASPVEHVASASEIGDVVAAQDGAASMPVAMASDTSNDTADVPRSETDSGEDAVVSKAKLKLPERFDPEMPIDPSVAPERSFAEAAKATAEAKGKEGETAAAIQPTTIADKSTMPTAMTLETPAANAAPQRADAEDNVDRIVTSVRGEIAKGGGTVQIRLDPPSLGQVNVQISVDDGVLSASLQTTNDEATRLLGHNLQQLKTTLEHAGVTVDRIQVKQAAPAESSSGSHSGSDNADRRQGDSSATQDQSARQEQQRRQMLQRMWARVAGDPLDLVA